MGQFEKWLQDNLIIVAGIFVGIALLQVSPCLQADFLANICDFVFALNLQAKLRFPVNTGT